MAYPNVWTTLQAETLHKLQIHALKNLLILDYSELVSTLIIWDKLTEAAQFWDVQSYWNGLSDSNLQKPSISWYGYFCLHKYALETNETCFIGFSK